MKPKIIIVNDKDEVIGVKERGTLKENDIYRVSALWITNSKEEILLARRAYTKKHDPGQWGPAVAGTVDEGETYESNIVKEAEEELGLKNIHFKKESKQKRFGKHKHFSQWFSTIVDQPIEAFKVQEEEVAEIKWFNKEELANYAKEHPEEFLEDIQLWLAMFP